MARDRWARVALSVNRRVVPSKAKPRNEIPRRGGMALQISALLSHVKVLPRCPGALSRGRADLQAAGVKFKHPSPGSPPPGAEPAARPRRGHIDVARKFSTTLWKSSRGLGSSAGWLGKAALGAALGASAAALVQSLHTGTLAAMALKVNLSSAEGDWKQSKGELVRVNTARVRRVRWRCLGSVLSQLLRSSCWSRVASFTCQTATKLSQQAPHTTEVTLFIMTRLTRAPRIHTWWVSHLFNMLKVTTHY